MVERQNLNPICGGHDNRRPIALYDYQATRAGTHAANFLQGFSGYLQVDGYTGYQVKIDLKYAQPFS